MEDKKYQLRIGIDIGSTNTVVAYQFMEPVPDEPNHWKPVEEIMNEMESIWSYPTLMVLKEDNPQHPKVEKDYFGDEAAQLLRECNIKPKIQERFKQMLYDSIPGSDEDATAKHLLTVYLGFLCGEIKRVITKKIGLSYRNDMSCTLRISTPLRAKPKHAEIMKELAKAANFTPANGFDSIDTTPSQYNEAACIARFVSNALEQKSSKIWKTTDPAKIATREKIWQQLMVKAQSQPAYLLIVDAGGSTMDLAIYRWTIDQQDKRQEMQIVNNWPNTNVSDEPCGALGGEKIDEAIKEFLIKKGFGCRDFADQEWYSKRSPDEFRMLKEDYNEILSNEDGYIDRLNNVYQCIVNSQNGEKPDKLYATRSPEEKINHHNFENDICKDFIAQMKKAITSLFDPEKQNHFDNELPVQFSDIDAVICSGLGSKLYFIPDVIREMGFTKINQEPERLYSDWENPSGCCALGMISDGMDIPNTSTYTCSITVDFFDIPYNLGVYFRKGKVSLKQLTWSKDNTGEIDVGKETFSYQRICSESIELVKRYELLPKSFSKELESSFNALKASDDNIAVVTTVYYTDSNGQTSEYSRYVTVMDESASHALMDLFTGGFKLFVGSIWSLFDKEGITKAFGKGKTMHFSARLGCGVDKSGKISLMLNLSGSGFSKTENAISINLDA